MQKLKDKVWLKLNCVIFGIGVCKNMQLKSSYSLPKQAVLSQRTFSVHLNTGPQKIYETSQEGSCETMFKGHYVNDVNKPLICLTGSDWITLCPTQGISGVRRQI